VELIEDDVREDYITAETAETTYGLSERKKDLAAFARLSPAVSR
jgi:5-oxoprolinase (ATP-hydrolysing)/N-methylhydantoinase A